MKFLSSKWVKRIQIAFIALIICSTAIILVRLWDEIKEVQWQFNSLYLALSIAIVALAIQGWAVVWAWMFKILGRDSTPLRQIMNIYLYSNMAKYIPGSLWNYVARGYLGYQKGVKQTPIWTASLIEILVSLNTGLILYLISLYFPHYGNPYLPIPWLLLLILIILAAASPPVLSKIDRWIGKLRKDESPDDARISLDWASYLIYLLASLMIWAVIGAAFYFLLLSLYPIPIEFLPEAIGLWSFSMVVGLVSIGIPQGLGVKEGILVYAMASALPISTAFPLAIISRFWIIACEWLAILSWWVFTTLSEKITQKYY